ncbi:MAG: putative RNase H-like HicB family nuclease [Planctomycetota bacterium]|jgi:predicted RNase H-like HicB family nuclease
MIVQGVDTRKYLRVLSWSEADGAWLVDVPELPYTTGDGATPEDAFREADEKIQAWIEIALEDGEDIPQPRGRESLVLS